VFAATLFDYNGVLVDDEDLHFAAFAEVMQPFGVELSRDGYVARYMGFDDVGAFRAMLDDAGMEYDDARVRELVELKKPVYARRAERGLAIFPGAGAAVRALSALGPVGVVSGALRSEIELGLELLNVRELVKFVVAAEDTLSCKPDPEGYRLALQRLGEVAPRSVLVVEDSLAGVQAARAAGTTCVAVCHSYSEAELRRAGADWVLPTVEELSPAQVQELALKLHA